MSLDWGAPPRDKLGRQIIRVTCLKRGCGVITTLHTSKRYRSGQQIRETDGVDDDCTNCGGKACLIALDPTAPP